MTIQPARQTASSRSTQMSTAAAGATAAMPRAEGENAASVAASAEFGRRVYLVDIAFLGRRWKGPEKRRTRREGERSNRQLRWAAATAGKDPETRSVSDSLHPRPLPRTAPFLSQARVVLLEGLSWFGAQVAFTRFRARTKPFRSLDFVGLNSVFVRCPAESSSGFE